MTKIIQEYWENDDRGTCTTRLIFWVKYLGNNSSSLINVTSIINGGNCAVDPSGFCLGWRALGEPCQKKNFSRQIRRVLSYTAPVRIFFFFFFFFLLIDLFCTLCMGIENNKDQSTYLRLIRSYWLFVAMIYHILFWYISITDQKAIYLVVSR